MKILKFSIEEALPTSLAKQFSLKKWKPNMKMFDRLTPFFGGDNVYRKTYPITSVTWGGNTNSVDKSIAFCLGLVGYNVHNWAKLTCIPCKGDAKPTLIGKVLEANYPPNSGVKQLFLKNQQALQNLEKNQDVIAAPIEDANVMGIISRHPYDIAGMSAGRSWSGQSCMTIGAGKWNSNGEKYIPKDIVEGTLVAYLIYKTDTNIEHPLSRLLVLPYVNDNDEILYGVRQKFYGLQDQPQFWNSTKLIAEEINKSLSQNYADVSPSNYKLHPSLYTDSLSTSLGQNIVDDVENVIRIPGDTTVLPTNIGPVVEGTYDCAQTKITSLKNSPKIVGGDFLCRVTNIQNLKHGPVIVQGTFDCSRSYLTSLQGAPQEVGGDFTCNNNQLTSLEGAPQEVGGDFVCKNNKLTSLEGAPKEVGGSFYCYNNQLTSLEGAPQEVGGDFYCKNNQLTSLEGAPQKVGGDFYCKDNQLTSLQGAPQEVGGGFECQYNNLTSLQGAPQKVGGDFYCSHNQLTSLEGAPQKVDEGFYCYNNQLTSLEGAPQEVGGDFVCRNNKKQFTEAEIRAVCNVQGGVYT